MQRFLIDPKGRSLTEIIPQIEEAPDMTSEELEDLLVRAFNISNFEGSEGLFLRARKALENASSIIDHPLLHSLIETLRSKKCEFEFREKEKNVDGIIGAGLVSAKKNKALKHADRAIELFPDSWLASFQRGSVLIAHNDWSGALEQFNTVREKFSGNSWVLSLFDDDGVKDLLAQIEHQAKIRINVLLQPQFTSPTSNEKSTRSGDFETSTYLSQGVAARPSTCTIKRVRRLQNW
jgi:tetratricopeptide (TPR) repeat protein